jgi:cell division protease FtsH
LKKTIRGPLLYVIVIIIVVMLAPTIIGNVGDKEYKKYSPDFLELVREGNISQLVVSGHNVYGLHKDTQIREADFPRLYDFRTYIPDTETFTRDIKLAIADGRPIEDVDLSTAGFIINFQPPEQESWLVSLLPFLIMGGLLVAVWYFMMQQSQMGGGKAMQFGKSRARMATGDKNKITFNDVAGADEEKLELSEIVEFLKNPKRFSDLGARIPKGVLLIGPPGTGKTLLAKAVAGEANVPFFSISGSDFVELFVGVGASRVRDLFENAKKNNPCIIFIDEIDAVGRHRGAGMGGGHDEREQTLNQLLVEMDGFNVNTGIIILAATNRPDILDPALLRPGRFDRQISVNLPDVKGREEILKVHARNKPFASEVDLKVLAKRTPGFTGADLENVLNEGAILTARANKEKITMEELEEAITRVIVGPEKKSRIMTENDKEITAYHEAGHAIIARVLPDCDPVHEISIIPRGHGAAGYTMSLPKDDKIFVTKNKLMAHIVQFLGGRAAESLVFDDVSTGAESDLKRSTEIARRMITEFGMSDELGPVYLAGTGGSEVFLGRDYGHVTHFSEEVTAKIDAEIRKIMNESYEKAKDILRENIDKLHIVSKELLSREKLYAEEFEELFTKGTLEPSVQTV